MILRSIKVSKLVTAASLIFNIFLLYCYSSLKHIRISGGSLKRSSISDKYQYIFNYGRIYNHQWVPLNPAYSSDINLVDNLQGDWMRNKTILLIGDSVDRKTVEWLCRYKNWNLTAGYYPGERLWEYCGMYNGCPRICTSPELNLTIANAFLVGLNPNESLRIKTGRHFPYTQTMDPKRRLMEVYLPYLHYLRGNPDIVIFNSGLWDLMHWTREFLSKNVSATDYDVVTADRLSQYAKQLDDFTNYLKVIFPKSLLMWRDLPSSPPGRDQAWGILDLPGYRLNGEAKMFRNTYIDSLNIASKDMFERKHTDIILIPWNSVTRGEMSWVDDIHPAGPVYKAVVNMWLYYTKARFS